MITRKSQQQKARKPAYGWERDGKFYLSRWPQEDKGGANEYSTKDEAETVATQRGLEIKWANNNG